MATTEIQDTARRLQEAGRLIADRAAEIKAVADQLRVDVDALAERVRIIEEK